MNNKNLTNHNFKYNSKPNLNFWIDSPVIVNNINSPVICNDIDKQILYFNPNSNYGENFSQNFYPKQILSNDTLLKKIENIIQTHPYKLDYKVNDKNLNLNKLCDFVNKNYVNEHNEKFKFIYNPNFFKYYIDNSLVISFYSIKTEKYPVKMIGLIIGKKTKLFINSVKFNSVEVNFLTLDPKVRNINLSSLMISILAKETIINYSIGVAHYTINNPIKAPNFCLKYYYHRMINIDKLFECEFISEPMTNVDKYKILYNSFKNYLPNQKILYFTKKSKVFMSKHIIELVNFIYKNINQYSKSKYKIYDYKSKKQIFQMFDSELFHHFIFVESEFDLKFDSLDKFKIKNYICLNELDTLCTKTKISYSNGYIYTGFFNDKIDIVIEKLSEYIYSCFANNIKIIDVITWSDFFDVENSYSMAVKGNGFLKYYLYNIQTNLIINEFNGLVTL